MSSEVIDNVIAAWPPDYDLDGAEVEAMIRDMPGRPHMPTKLPDRFEDNSRRPPSAREVPVFDEKMVEALFHAVDYLRQEFKGFRREWPITNYDVLLSWYTEYGLVDIAFCPKVETFVQGGPFEVADRGMYRNGPGIEFVLSLSDYSLVKRVYMR
jgi:hypothetical protein